MTIGFIGLGNMAKAIIAGMLKNKIVESRNIIGTAKTGATMEAVHVEYGIGIRNTNAEVAKEANVLVLAVKPQFFEAVIREIREVVEEDTLIISIAAGKTMAWIEDTFAKEIKLVRCMPNTPALVGAGCTGLCANARVSRGEIDYSKKQIGRAHV